MEFGGVIRNVIDRFIVVMKVEVRQILLIAEYRTIVVFI